jgi:hypothetical protein
MAPSKLKMEVASSPLKVEASMGGGEKISLERGRRGEEEEQSGSTWGGGGRRHRQRRQGRAGVEEGLREREREVGGEWRCGRTRREEVG